MLTDKVLIGKASQQYIQVFEAIHTEVSKDKLESHYDSIDQWELDYAEYADSIAEPLVSILYDEIRRKKSQLRNKPGRQPATDWLKQLENHLSRMENELAVIDFFVAAGDDEVPPALQALILNSFEFSSGLVKADVSQIEKRVDAGDFVLSDEQQGLMQRASDVLEKALNFGATVN